MFAKISDLEAIHKRYKKTLKTYLQGNRQPNFKMGKRAEQMPHEKKTYEMLFVLRHPCHELPLFLVLL